MKILEGLLPYDLKGMVDHQVSIDMHKSKIDDSAVVIAFMVKDKAAAEDLNRFIQKSHIDILDTEISTVPSQFGAYQIYVEIAFSDDLAKDIMGICSDISSLTGIKKWKLSIRKLDDVIVETSDIEQALLPLVDILKKENSKIKNTIGESYDVLDMGTSLSVYLRNKIMEKNIIPTTDLFGPNWSVGKMGNKIIAESRINDKVIIFRRPNGRTS